MTGAAQCDAVGTMTSETTMTESAASLRLIKLVHTAVWVFFAGAICAIPVCAASGRYGTAVALIGIVFFEVLVLIVNDWRCPLTDVAARLTDDRRDNFDIYLSPWLARHNKWIFGVLYVAGIVLTMLLWAQT
jgi:hypothetical protein